MRGEKSYLKVLGHLKDIREGEIFRLQSKSAISIETSEYSYRVMPEGALSRYLATLLKARRCLRIN